METPHEELIPLSKAADYAGRTPEHLNLLARKGKLTAKKIGRNWFTKKQWVDEYFKDEKNQSKSSVDLKVRELEMREKIELARIAEQEKTKRTEIETRAEIQKAKFALQKVSNKKNTNQGQKQSQGKALIPAVFNPRYTADWNSLKSNVREELKKLNREKLKLEEFVKNQILAMQRDLREEQGRKEALLFAFENLQNQVSEDLERRSAELYYQLIDRFNSLLQSYGLQEDKKWKQELLESEIEKKELAKFFAEQLQEIRQYIGNRDHVVKQQHEQKTNKQVRREKSIKKLEVIKKHLTESLTPENSAHFTADSANSPSPEKKNTTFQISQRKENKLYNFFNSNKTKFLDEQSRAEHFHLGNVEISQPALKKHKQNYIDKPAVKIKYKTIFLKLTNPRPKSNLPNQHQVSKWKRRALHIQGIHNIKIHPERYKKEYSEKINNNKTDQASNISFQQLDDRPRKAVGIALAFTAFLFTAFALFSGLILSDSQNVNFSFLEQVGTEDTFFARSFDRLISSAVYEVKNVPGDIDAFSADLAKLKAKNHILNSTSLAQRNQHQISIERGVLDKLTVSLENFETYLETKTLDMRNLKNINNAFFAVLSRPLVEGQINVNAEQQNGIFEPKFIQSVSRQTQSVLSSYAATFTQAITLKNKNKSARVAGVSTATDLESADNNHFHNFFRQISSISEKISSRLEVFAKEVRNQFFNRTDSSRDFSRKQ